MKNVPGDYLNADHILSTFTQIYLPQTMQSTRFWFYLPSFSFLIFNLLGELSDCFDFLAEDAVRSDACTIPLAVGSLAAAGRLDALRRDEIPVVAIFWESG